MSPHTHTHRLVAKKDVHIRHNLQQGLLEELTDEWSRQIQAEDFVVFRSVFGYLQDRLQGHGQEEPLQNKTKIIVKTCAVFETTASQMVYLLV